MDSSLARGSAGLAVFYASLAEAGIVADADKCALAFLSHAVDLLAAEPRGPSLFGGFTGTAWAVTYLEDRVFEASGGDPNEGVDETLRQLLRRSPWRGEFGVAGGLVGYGVYALERLHSATGVECLEMVVNRLHEIAEHDDLGATWFTSPRFLTNQQRSEAPAGHYNLGMAYGTPGVIALLGQVCACEEEKLRGARRKAGQLLERAVPWLLAQQPGNQSFARWIGPDIKPTPAHLAWCYGDLGIAIALLQAARATENAGWERAALKIAHRAARCPVEKSGVAECGLCHGAAGAGHLFNRLYQATGDEALKHAACSWLLRALEMSEAGQEAAGIPRSTSEPKLATEQRWNTSLGILEGSAGVGLALLAAITDIEPEWDRVMLTAIGGPGRIETPTDTRNRARGV
jgi:lantibiotic modifying enzyme